MMFERGRVAAQQSLSRYFKAVQILGNKPHGPLHQKFDKVKAKMPQNVVM
jgi:hypothetical protein